MRISRGAFLLVFGLTIIGCRKDPDFLHYRKYEAAQTYSKTQKVKDFNGILDLDILWVIDNSGSMLDHQNSVIRNTDTFVNIFTRNSSLHWKMGLISTDTIDQPYEGFDQFNPLDYTKADAVPRFRTAVRNLGTSGSALEMTFEPIINALTRYRQFVRPNSMLAIIVVSDAPEQSRFDAIEFLRRLQTFKPDLSKVVFYGVLGPVDWCRATDDTWIWGGSDYYQVLQSVQGKTFPICSADFGNNLVTLGEDLYQRISTPKIYLDARPDVKTIQVLYQGNEIPGGPKADGGLWYYDYDLNAIVFYDLSFAPGDTEEIEVKFDEDVGRSI
jgi:hypothetical protein